MPLRNCGDLLFYYLQFKSTEAEIISVCDVCCFVRMSFYWDHEKMISLLQENKARSL